MNNEELARAINECIGERSSIEIYLGLKNQQLRKGNFIENTQQQIKNLFISELQNKIINVENSIVNFSSADERGNVIYQYDLELTEKMHIFELVNNAENNIERFSFQVDGINNIAYFLIIIGVADHQVTIYKQLASVNVYKKNSGFFIRETDNQFTQIEDDFLRIVPGVDLIYINNELYIKNLDVIEKAFDIHNVIITSARTQIDMISQYNLVENIDCLSSELSDISFARKLSKISQTSPVLGHIENQNIILFTQNHPILRKVFKYSDDGTKIKLTSKKSKRLFIKLLNDDYLTSNLTNIYYDSLAKDPVEQ